MMETKRIESHKLTYPQKNIWMVEKWNENTPINSIIGLVHIHKNFKAEYCQKAIEQLVEKNDAMRIELTNENNQIKQYISENNVGKIEVVDLSENTEKEISVFFNDSALRPLFSMHEPLYEFKILKYKNDTGCIYMKIHHMIADAWSCSKIAGQIISYYQNLFHTSREASQDVECPSYLTFIQNEKVYAQSEKYQRDAIFWKEYLDGFSDVVSLKNMKSLSLQAQRYSVALEQELLNSINQFCKEQKISVYSLFMAVLSIYVAKITEKKDIILGTPALNRCNFKEKQMLGMFVATLPFRIKIEEKEESFLSFVKNVTSTILLLFRHQRYPYLKTLEQLHQHSQINSNIYQIVLSYQNARVELDTNQFSTEWQFVNTLADELQIHIVDMDDTGILTLNYDYQTDKFSNEEIQYIHQRLIYILQQVIVKPTISIEEIKLIPNEELQLLEQLNDTSSWYPKDKTIIDMFLEQVEKNPDKIALTYFEKKLTYMEMYQQVRQFAKQLDGIRHENILVCLDNSIELLIAIYGILYSGNCYVPLNTQTPKDRIRDIAKDCQCHYAILNDKILDDKAITYLTVSKECEMNTQIQKSLARPDELAYIIYTSGSTGMPKGVKISNQSLVNYIYWAKHSYVDVETPIMPLYSSIAFDLTVTTLFLPLISGGYIVICENNNEEIIKIFREDKVNIVKLTPAHLSLINEANIRVNNIHTLILGGEALKTADARKITIKNKKVRIFNEYGPTEATVGCMIYPFRKQDAEPTVAIGKPAANVQLYILNQEKKQCPIGVEGELYIGGDGIANGYHNNEIVNKKSFFISPNTGRKIYKTGDIVKLGFDLELRYIGRIDKQIKINGNRIELEEIENVSKKLFKFKNVIADVKYISNIPNICLYYISENEYKSRYIRQKLKKYLPYYMLPSRYIKIEKIPMNGNGKLVRNQLPVPTIEIKKNKILYQSALEKNVCKIWNEILKQEIDPERSIFDYGVDSLNIIRCQVKLSNIISVVDVQKFYEYPIIREFCQNINQIQEKKVDINELKKYETIQLQKQLDKTKQEKISKVMLIGATGFLGIHMLKELLESPQIEKVYCIVRGIDYQNRLKNRFQFYFGELLQKEYEQKVIVINGNIEQKNLGLSKKEIEPILQEIHRVINTAAIVKHHGAYSEFEMINVGAVRNIVEICLNYHVIMDHISTISIAGDCHIGMFTEDKFYIGQNYRINPYIETKFEAELYLFQKIKEEGLLANIYRVGNLTWRCQDGVYQKNILNNGFFMRMKNILDLGKYPASFAQMKVEMTPVDIAANFIVTLILGKSDTVNEIYHIFNQNQVDFLEMIHSLETVEEKDIIQVEDETFMQLLKSYDSRENVLLNDIISSIGTIEVQLDNTYTNEILQRLNKKWPYFQAEYINKMVPYLKSLEGRKNEIKK